MKRIAINPRPDWEQKMLDQGFLFYSTGNYYSESAAYEFSYDEIVRIETATAQIHEMCLEVVEYVVQHKLWDEFFIPREYRELIAWSWKNRQPSIYGRFDLAMNNGQIKLLEFNADTPTLLLESSVIQWSWLQDYNKALDQYNNIHKQLVQHFKDIKQYLLPGKLYFSGPDVAEDFVTVKYLEDAASQSGIETEFLFIGEIRVNEEARFTDANNKLIKNIFKLYPYEWLFNEPFGQHLVTNRDECNWIEPPYKAILSNKMLLKYLCQLFPASPYILPCTYLKDGDRVQLPMNYAKKPVFSREGANVRLVKNGEIIEETYGAYGSEGYVCQEYFELPEFDGWHPVIGSWMIGSKPAGIGIRESKDRITNTGSHFCSHYIAAK